MKNEKKDTGVYTFLNREPQLTGDVIEYGSWIEVSEDGRTPIDSQRLAEFIILTQPWIVINGCIYEYDNGVYRLLPSNEVKDRIIEMLMGKGIWPTQLEYVMDLIKKDDRMVVSPDLVDCKSNLLNIKNGLYDLETKKLYAHSPEYISTQKHKIVYEVNNFEERLTD